MCGCRLGVLARYACAATRSTAPCRLASVSAWSALGRLRSSSDRKTRYGAHAASELSSLRAALSLVAWQSVLT